MRRKAKELSVAALMKMMITTLMAVEDDVEVNNIMYVDLLLFSSNSDFLTSWIWGVKVGF